MHSQVTIKYIVLSYQIYFHQVTIKYIFTKLLSNIFSPYYYQIYFHQVTIKYIFTMLLSNIFSPCYYQIYFHQDVKYIFPIYRLLEL